MQAFHGEKELFASDHCDEVLRETIIGKCFVHKLKKYQVRLSANARDVVHRQRQPACAPPRTVLQPCLYALQPMLQVYDVQTCFPFPGFCII